MRQRTKLVEIVCRVRVPKHWSAAHTRREVAQYWYGEIYALGPPKPDELLRDEVVLRPKWQRAGAHIVKED